MTLENQKRLIALLIGITTVTAGIVTWRAGQLGSSSAYEDRTSVGQTIKEQQLEVEASMAAIDDTLQDIRYQADYAEAAAFDDRADELAALGEDALAASSRERADNLRLAATTRAAAAGVFGRQTLYQDLARPTDEPRPFDFTAHLEKLQVEISSGIGAPGPLDPDSWAAQADDTRTRVRGLRWAALVLLAAVVLLTVAQTTDRFSTRWLTAGAGIFILVATTTATAVTVW